MQHPVGAAVLYSLPRKAESGPPLPEDFDGATTPENSSQVWIEEFFGDPTLIGLIDQTQVGNQELRILNEDVQIASNEVLARRGAYLPFVTAGGGPSVTKPGLYTPEGAVEHDLHVLPGVPFPNPLPKEAPAPRAFDRKKAQDLTITLFPHTKL